MQQILQRMMHVIFSNETFYLEEKKRLSEEEIYPNLKRINNQKL